MTKNMKKLSMLTLACFLVMAAGSAFAQTTVTSPAPMAVSATIADNCTITTSALNFGAYDPIVANPSGTPLNQQATLSIDCTNNTSAFITLGQGANPGGGSTNAAPVRQMLGPGGNLMSYNLFTDNTYLTVWNNTTGVNYTGTGVLDNSVQVFGQVPGGQTSLPAGTYNDTVVVSITFN